MTIFLFNLIYNRVGDKMKGYIKVIIIAILIGGLIAFFFYKDIKNEVNALTSQDNTINLFQVGVYKIYDNALNCKNSYDNAIIYEDNGLYRVIIAGVNHVDAKVKLEAFFTNQNIKYYIKDIKVSSDIVNKINNYELVLIKTDSEDVIMNINKSILDTLLPILS